MNKEIIEANKRLELFKNMFPEANDILDQVGLRGIANDTTKVEVETMRCRSIRVSDDIRHHLKRVKELRDMRVINGGDMYYNLIEEGLVCDYIKDLRKVHSRCLKDFRLFEKKYNQAKGL